jgi:hypothetical protein
MELYPAGTQEWRTDMASELDFGNLEADGQVEWPKRGRKPAPLPDKLVDVLGQSLAFQTTPKMVMPSEQVDKFANLLNKAGRDLNYRIERHVETDVPEAGLSTYHFRVRGMRKKDE